MKRTEFELKDLKFGENGLVPVVVQDWLSGEVLMLAYANGEAVERTVETATSWFYSRSHNGLWRKGETSGNTQRVIEVRADCDSDAVLYLVEPKGPACHTGNRSCFFRVIASSEHRGQGLRFLAELEKIIEQREKERPEGSYTAKLFSMGLEGVLQKLEEESCEVVDAARNKEKGELRWEIADLLFHLMVLMRLKGLSLSDVVSELESRRR